MLERAGGRIGDSAQSRRPPLGLPPALRNRLAGLVLRSLHDAGARRILEALAARRAAGWITSGDREYAAVVGERARRAAAAVATRPVARPAERLCEALADAAALFDAGLYFEAHELLEPYWMAAAGAERDVLQGLIQIAVGYEHLANGNARGSRRLLGEGVAKIAARGIGGLDLAAFAESVRAMIAPVAGGFDWRRIPRFPTREGP